jgi:hypothetical protein
MPMALLVGCSNEHTSRRSRCRQHFVSVSDKIDFAPRSGKHIQRVRAMHARMTCHIPATGHACDRTLNEVAPATDPVLVGAMIRAYRWRDLLESGAAKSVEWISRTEHVNASYLAKLLSLAYLAPDLTDEILNGTQPPHLMLKNIRELEIPLDWQAQRRLFARFRA